MKCLLLYGTLSGSTMTATELVAASLRESGHEALTLSVDQANSKMLASYNAVVIASPSWEDRGVDGQPLPEVRQFIESLTSSDLDGKKIALLGLGDTAYPQFCGAIDIMEKMLKNIRIIPSIESLRIDRYYSVPDNEHKVAAWAEKFASSLGK